MKRLPAALAGLFACLLLAGPAYAGDPIMPLSDVHGGMHCTGYSVIRGTTISSFDVDVIDVTEDGILIEASGPAVDQTASARASPARRSTARTVRASRA